MTTTTDTRTLAQPSQREIALQQIAQLQDEFRNVEDVARPYLGQTMPILEAIALSIQRDKLPRVQGRKPIAIAHFKGGKKLYIWNADTVWNFLKRYAAGEVAA